MDWIIDIYNWVLFEISKLVEMGEQATRGQSYDLREQCEKLSSHLNKWVAIDQGISYQHQ